MAIQSRSHHEALAAYAHSGKMPVVGRFERALHVLAPDGQVITVAPLDVDGPLTCLLSSSDWHAVSRSEHIRFSASPTLPQVCASKVDSIIELRDTVEWNPRHSLVGIDLDYLAKAKAALVAHAGDSAFFHGDYMGMALHSLRKRALRQLEDQDLSGLKSLIGQMAGLGPGLTPAGADWLVGLSTALILLEVRSRFRSFVYSICACVKDADVLRATTRLSRTLMQFSVHGVASQALLDMIQAMANSHVRLNQSIEQVIAIGHTSGCDMAVGVSDAVAVMLAWSSDG